MQGCDIYSGSSNTTDFQTFFDASFYKSLLDQMADGVYFVDQDRKILYWSKGAERLTGYTASEVVGRLCPEDLLRHMDVRGQRLNSPAGPLDESLQFATERQDHVLLVNKQGKRVPVKTSVKPIQNEQGEVVGAVEIFSDASSEFEMRRRTESMRRMAFLDHMTQIPNRRFMEVSLEMLLKDETPARDTFGVLLVDLDNFKQINDAYGHSCGDQALRETTRLLTSAFRPTDLVGRWGGDEFLIIASNVSLPILETLANRCVQQIASARINFNDLQFQLSLSVGAALARPGDSLASLLDRVDQLMYRSKNEGRSRATME